MASLHFGSLCCRARGMSLNGYLRGDQHVWRLFKCFFCHRVRGFGAAYILALLEFQDPVSGVACARLGSRFRGFWRQTTWPPCSSARFAVMLEECHSMVAFAVTDTYSVCPSAFLPSCAWFWRGFHPGTFGVSRSCKWCSLCSSWVSL